MWNASALWLHNVALVVPFNAHLQVQPPTIVFLEQPFNWIGTLLPACLSFLQFLFLAALTFHTFRSNAQQKVAEREAAWYHKVVVDHSLDAMSKFFRRSSDELCGIIVKHDQLHQAGEQVNADDLIRESLAKFKRELYMLNDDVAGRLSTFESSPVRLFTARLEKLEDDVASWFDNYGKAQPYDQRESLPRILTICQVELLRLLKSYEFETWGWPRRKATQQRTA